jgi:hypothetical protein
VQHLSGRVAMLGFAAALGVASVLSVVLPGLRVAESAAAASATHAAVGATPAAADATQAAAPMPEA